MNSLSIQEHLKNKKFSLSFKRVFDILFSILGLIIMFIPMIIISILIKTQSDGPVFFRQVRVGKNGKDFEILKFRTMIVDAEKKGKQITIGDDPRITKIGSFLRKTKLDEFPQLINVLKGEMSFVGPRPEVRHYVEMYNEEQKKVLLIRPGITDRASIIFRDEAQLLAKSDNPEETYIHEIMPKKLEYNLDYIRNFSVWTDIRLILETLRKII